MSHTIAHSDPLDREGSWSLVRRTLGVRSSGIHRGTEPARLLMVSAPAPSGLAPMERA